METIYSNDGCLTKLRYKLNSTKEVCLAKWNDTAFFHLNCRKDCFLDNGSYDKTKSKSISLRWDTAKDLKLAIQEMEQYVPHMLSEVRFNFLFVKNYFFKPKD